MKGLLDTASIMLVHGPASIGLAFGRYGAGLLYSLAPSSIIAAIESGRRSGERRRSWIDSPIGNLPATRLPGGHSLVCAIPDQEADSPFHFISHTAGLT
jgi:hypothetical protein